MKKKHALSILCILAAALMQPALSAGQADLTSTGTAQQPVSAAVKSKINQWMATNGGLSFLENKGQMADMNGKPAKGLLFKVSGNGVDMYVTTSGLSYVFTNKKLHTKTDDPGDKKTTMTGQYCRADMVLVGASIQKGNIVKEDASSSYNNYYLGNCPNGVLNVHSYQRITIKNIYPGIDWVLYTAAGADKGTLKKTGLQYDFIVHPGANPSDIKICYKWANKPEMQNDGSLKINIPLGNITEGTPLTYQSSDINQTVHTSYILHNGEVGFALANYNKNKSLVIDPAIYWSTYYGGSGTDAGNSVWSDGTHVWVTGNTSSSNFPTTTLTGAYNQGTLTGATQNAFILCFTTNGVPVWATYYGGTTAGESDGGQSITGDANNIWVLITTSSSATFPVANPNNYDWYQTYDTIYNNTGLTSGNVAAGKTKATPVNNCAVVLEFTKAGVREYASYIGGTAGSGDSPRAISDDGTDVWYTGYASSTNFPVLYSAGYYNKTWTNNAITVIGEWSATTGNLLWSTYYGNGSSGSQLGQAICSDGTNVWITGRGYSGDMPVTNPGGGAYYQGTDPSGAYQQAYIAQISIESHTTTWCTYFGGTPTTAYNFGLGIYSNGRNVWVTGESSATAATFPGVNPGGGAYYQAAAGGGTYDAFIAEFTTAGVQKWATLYGGSGSTESAPGINVDNKGNVWVTGTTTSTNLPTLSECGAYNSSSLGGTQNAFILQFDTNGVQKWGTYLGGTTAGETDAGNSIFGDGINVWATGNTISTSFPTQSLSGAYNQASNGGGQDAYLVNFPLLSDTLGAIVNVSCNGESNGSATVGARAGTAPFAYSWAPTGETNATATGLSAGTYTVTVTDNCGNTASISATITQPNVLTASANPPVNISCNGGANGRASTTISGGTTPYTYSWAGGETTDTATGLSAGTYTLGVEDANGCTSSAMVTLTQPNALLVSTTTTANVLCNGGANGSASSAISGGTGAYTYSWTGGGTTDTATGLSAGTYVLSVEDANGCTNSASVTITQPNVLMVSANPTANASCNGESNGSASSTVSGGTTPYTYSWTGGGITDTATGLSAGTYTLGVEDANGCSSSTSVTITQPNVLMVSVSTTANVSCNGESNGSASSTVSGGTTPYTYSWTGGGITDTATGLSAGTYTLGVEDANGCSSSTSVTITQPNVLMVSVSTTANVSCNGESNGSASSMVSGGTAPYTYSWTGGGTTDTATGLSAGTYILNVEDANGCSVSVSTAITQPTPMIITTSIGDVTSGAACNGSAAISVSGGTAPYTYSWAGGGTNDTISGKCAGNYCCTITDKNGCSETSCVTINNITGINNIGQGGGQITVYPNPTNGQFTLQSSITGGNWSVEIYNMLGEKVYSQFSIQNPQLTINLANEPGGIYLYRVINENGNLLGEGKIIIQK